MSNFLLNVVYCSRIDGQVSLYLLHNCAGVRDCTVEHETVPRSSVVPVVKRVKPWIEYVRCHVGTCGVKGTGCMKLPQA